MADNVDQRLNHLSARLVAAETLLMATTVRLYRLLGAMGAPIDVDEERARLSAEYAKVAIPGVDPATSDLLAGEFQESIDSLLRGIASRL